MARDYDVSALGLALWQGLFLDSAGRWKVSLADEISSLPFHTFKANMVASSSTEGRTVTLTCTWVQAAYLCLD